MRLEVRGWDLLFTHPSNRHNCAGLLVRRAVLDRNLDSGGKWDFRDLPIIRPRMLS